MCAVLNASFNPDAIADTHALDAAHATDIDTNSTNTAAELSDPGPMAAPWAYRTPLCTRSSPMSGGLTDLTAAM